MTAAVSLPQAYRHCAHIVKTRARNFYYTFIVLPPDEQQAIYALYAFCRVVDDAADEEGNTEGKRRKLEQYRTRFDAAMAGSPDSPVLVALADAVTRYAIPQHLFHELIDGMLQDLTTTRYDTFEALIGYCYLAASTVGLMCLPIFGVTDEAATPHGVDLGLAMQLTNIMRDVAEDAERDRIYIPRDMMDRHGVTENDIKSGQHTSAWRDLMLDLTERTAAYYASGHALLPYVPSHTRSSPALMHDVYNNILQKIIAADYDVFSRRIGPSRYEKMLMVGRVWKEKVLR